jgi:hypothetical protein
VPRPSSTPREPSHERYLTIFLIDGLAHEVFTEELAQGRLPHITELISTGAYVERGITSFPSVSGYAYYPFVTGETSTASGTFGLRWFDRGSLRRNFRNYVSRGSQEFNGDLSDHVPTLFEQFDAGESGVYNSILHRGAEDPTTMSLDIFLSKYRGKAGVHQALAGVVQAVNIIPMLGLRDDVATNHRDLEIKLVRQAMEKLDEEAVQFVVLTSLDNLNHVHGYRTASGVRPSYVAQLELIDDLIGQYRARSREASTEGRRLYLIASDHGITSVGENTSIVAQLKDRFGLVYDRDTAIRRRTERDRGLAGYVNDGVDVVQALQGNTMSFLYFRNPNYEGFDAWHLPPSLGDLQRYPVRGDTGQIDLTSAIASMEGVELVIHRGSKPGRFRVTSAVGSSEIRQQVPGYSYTVISGHDPLRLSDVPHGVPLDERSWLRLTYDHHYPYAVPRLARLLTDHRDADMIVTSADGYDQGLDFEFIVGNYRGGHGGIDHTQMIVPFILHGPGIRAGATVPFALAEDVGSTLQLLMGVPPAHPDRVLEGVLVKATNR